MTPFIFTAITEKSALLEGEEARHCMKVMRHRPGERVIGVDGKGQMLSCIILETHKDAVTLEIMEREAEWGEKPLQVWLAVSLLHKPDRFEWLMEKAVELGVNKIVPYVGKHTVKTGFRPDRMERIMLAALKQCMRSRLPELVDAQPLAQALQHLPADLRLMGHIEGEVIGDGIATQLRAARSVALLIGPEGDFAPEELSAAANAGFTHVNLGTNRLRSETATIHLLSVVKHLAGY
jgi:16S rRNA (uracil1498-N3)-methyltransferase